MVFLSFYILKVKSFFLRSNLKNRDEGSGIRDQGLGVRG
jgi:hypothetical protein